MGKKRSTAHGLRLLADAIDRSDLQANGYCKHGVYVGGVGIDWMCGRCEDGTDQCDKCGTCLNKYDGPPAVGVLMKYGKKRDWIHLCWHCYATAFPFRGEHQYVEMVYDETAEAEMINRVYEAPDTLPPGWKWVPEESATDAEHGLDVVRLYALKVEGEEVRG